MVRIIQPGGFSRSNLVRIGLIPHVDEVVVISSPESMTQDELIRIQQAATDLGSKAAFTLHTMPVVGEDVTVSQMLSDLNHIKSTLSDKETWISTTGSTNKHVACIFATFPDHPTITMNRSNDSYYLSDGTTRPLTKLPDELNWQLLGLRHEQENGNHHLFHGDTLIASPGVAYMNGDKLVLKWDMPTKDQPNKEQTKVVKHISAQIGRLCRLNSEGVYEITIPQSRFNDRDRFPIGTHRPVKLNGEEKIHKNEMFSAFPKLDFPFGTQERNATCLHVAVNASDITPTAYAILAHKPSHIVLWRLNSGNVDQETELNGKTAYLVSYLSGHLLETLDGIFPKEQGQPSKANIFTTNPIPQIYSKFHLIDLSKLSDTKIELPEEVLNAERTLFDHNSGFPGLHHRILTILKQNDLDVEQWITDVNPLGSYQISKPNKITKPSQLNLSVFLLRKFLPSIGEIISNEEKIMTNIPDILEVIIDNAKVKKSSIGKPEQRWRINTGKFESKRGEEIMIHSQDDQVFNISNKKGDSLVIGRSGRNNAGNWLEDLAGYIIHHYWESEHSIIGLNANPILGNFRLGSTREVDNFAVTKYGVVVGEAKAVSPSNIEAQKEEITGQLMGVVSLFGHRRGQIPLIIIDHLSDGYDDFSIENGVVVCSWWELQYPDRIVHRFRHGTRTEEDKADLRKRREIKSPVVPVEDEKKGDLREDLEKSESRQEEPKKRKILFEGFIRKNLISFVEGNNRACLISECKLLEGKPIVFAKKKTTTLRHGLESDRCTGFNVKILEKIPDSLKKGSGIQDGLYMINCRPVETGHPPEEVGHSIPHSPNLPPNRGSDKEEVFIPRRNLGKDMSNTVLAILGDSTVPSLALLHSGQYDNLVFFYTRENEGKAAMFSKFSESAFPEINVEINKIPSINDPASIVEYAKKFCLEHENDFSIFVTAGAKQTILPFVAQAPEATLVSLQHSPPRLIMTENNVEKEYPLVGIELNQILATRGWLFIDTLRKGNQQFVNVEPRFDAHTGRLSFTGTSWLKRENREDEIHSLSKDEKKMVQNQDQTLTGELLQLAEDFGKNGANYSIKGALRSPNRAVLPPFIRHEIPLDEEE